MKQTLLIILIAAIIGIASAYISKKPDNVVEQVAERVIELELRMPVGSIDLTPESQK